MIAFFQLAWSLITSKFAGIAGFIAVLALSAAFAASTIKHDTLEAQLRHQVTVAQADEKSADAARALAVSDLANCHVSLANETVALETQGKAVTALSVESATRTADAAKALQQAADATAALSKREAAVTALKPGSDLCASALSAMKGEGQ